MAIPKAMLVLAGLTSRALVAQDARVTQLTSKDLTNLPGKEGLLTP